MPPLIGPAGDKVATASRRALWPVTYALGFRIVHRICGRAFGHPVQPRERVLRCSMHWPDAVQCERIAPILTTWQPASPKSKAKALARRSRRTQDQPHRSQRQAAQIERRTGGPVDLGLPRPGQSRSPPEPGGITTGQYGINSRFREYGFLHDIDQAGRRFADACEQDRHLVLRPPAGLRGPRSELSNGSIATVGMIQPDAATLHLWPNRTRVTGQEGWACPFKRWLVVLCRADDVVVRGRILGRNPVSLVMAQAVTINE
jgi:hypothetical protein